MTFNKYAVSPETIKNPPETIFQRIKFLGPSFILSASIIGSGELIATTTLGAKAGFTAFWVIIVSCLVKVTVQLEFGKYTIVHGQTAMQAFNLLPGLKLKKANWSIWSVLFLTILKIVQVGGIMGSAAIVLNILFPSLPIFIWTIFIAFLAAVLVFRGYYKSVEKLSIVMIFLFTTMTIISLISLHFTEFQITGNDLLTGLKFQLSGEATAIAIGAFGITGVASDEIIAYNYWCIEKGYASYTGPRTNTVEWMTRAKGWIKVMYLDALVAMVLYTLVTAAFYLLGAAILFKRGIVPEGNEVIETLASIYTTSLGDGMKVAFLIGAFFVLFSSIFSALAAWTRMFTDIFGQIGWIDFNNHNTRKKVIAYLSFIFPLLWASLFLFINLPVIMVISGGMVGAILLFIVIFAAWHFRYAREQFIQSSLIYDIALWISIISILLVGVFAILKLFVL